MQRLIAAINEQLWVGHFDIWTHTGMIMYRQALVLPGGLTASTAQCEAMLAGAIHACERYYPAFQFVVWAGKTAAGGDERGDVRYRGRGVVSLAAALSSHSSRPCERRDPYAVASRLKQTACGRYSRFTKTACGYGSLRSQGRRRAFVVTS